MALIIKMVDVSLIWYNDLLDQIRNLGIWGCVVGGIVILPTQVDFI
jgi:hypothetical protein